MEDRKKQQFTGVVRGFNISPRGYYEGLLLELKGAKLLQLNFAPEVWAVVAGVVDVGDKVKARAVAGEHDDDEHTAEHPVMDLLSITGARGKTITLGGHDRARLTRARGVVERINYAKHGEPNGAVLDSGEFVHLKPHGAKAVNLAVGQHLAVEGLGWPILLGSTLIEADTANGIDLSQHGKKKHGRKTRETALHR